MQIVIGNVLSAEEIKLVRAALKRARFIDGRATAGFAARMVKNNRQAEGARSLDTIRKLVAERALAAPFFALREKHALWQPRRRRADGRHAHRRLVHALPVRTDELRRGRAHDRKRGG